MIGWLSWKNLMGNTKNDWVAVVTRSIGKHTKSQEILEHAFSQHLIKSEKLFKVTKY
jgi:hypothetical protein